jgi:hypothetical protein
VVLSFLNAQSLKREKILEKVSMGQGLKSWEEWVGLWKFFQIIQPG